MSEYVAVVDIAGRVAAANAAFRLAVETHLGIAVPVGKSVLETLAPWPTEQQWASTIWQRVQYGHTASCIRTFATQSAVQTLEVVCRPILDATGKWAGAVVTGQDLTPNRPIFSATPDGAPTSMQCADWPRVIDELPVFFAVITAPDGRICFANRSLVSALRWTPPERSTAADRAEMPLPMRLGWAIPSAEWRTLLDAAAEGQTVRRDIFVEPIARPSMWIELCVMPSDIGRRADGSASRLVVWGVDITARRSALLQSRRQAETLEQQCAVRTATAEQHAAQLRALTAEMGRVEQQERQRLAGLLHDDLQQILVAAKMRLDLIIRRHEHADMPADADAGHAPTGFGADSMQLVAEARELLGTAIDTSRSLAAQLHPPILQVGGLVAALQWVARQFSERHRLSVTVESAPDSATLPLADSVRDFLFQAVRELLLNAVKHSNGSAASIAIDISMPEFVRITVTDNGRGCDCGGPNAAGFGLFYIQQRLEFFGGQFCIQNRQTGGCQVTLVAPFAPVPDSAARPRASKTTAAGAIDGNACAVDVAGSRGGEESNESGDFSRLSKPSSGHLGQ